MKMCHLFLDFTCFINLFFFLICLSVRTCFLLLNGFSDFLKISFNVTPCKCRALLKLFSKNLLKLEGTLVLVTFPCKIKVVGLLPPKFTNFIFISLPLIPGTLMFSKKLFKSLFNLGVVKDLFAR